MKGKDKNEMDRSMYNNRGDCKEEYNLKDKNGNILIFHICP